MRIMRMQGGAGNRKGIVLLLVLGVLGLLSVLAMAFVSMAKLERGMSANYMARVRSIMAAESGVEAAIAQVSAMPGGVIPADDLNRLTYQFTGLDENGFAEIPSFAADIDGDGAQDGVSGLMEGDLETGVSYRLMVEDASGKLNINDVNGPVNWDDDFYPDAPWPEPDEPLYDDPNPGDDNLAKPLRLYQILDRLVERLFGDPESPTGIGAVVASAILNGRDEIPGGRFTDYSQVRELLVGPDTDVNMSEDQFRTLLRHVTLYSWQDPNTLKPTYKYEITIPMGGMEPSYMPRINRAYLCLLDDTWGTSFELEPRCPVNVNTASEALLEALIAPVQGWYLLERPESERSATPGDYSHDETGGWLETHSPSGIQFVRYHTWYESSVNYMPSNSYSTGLGSMAMTALMPDPAEVARLLYERIHYGKDLDGNGDVDPAAGDIPAKPFETWDEFALFLREELPDTLFPSYPGDMKFDRLGFAAVDSIIQARGGDVLEWAKNFFRERCIDALLANFNPNSRIADYNPNRTTYTSVDKNHLANYTTEFCFEPTGVFEIHSQGRVKAGGVDQAIYGVSTSVRIFAPLRWTSQKQFMLGLQNSADAPQILGESSSSQPGTRWGSTLTSFPEPLHEDSADNAFSPWDGSLSLAAYAPDRGDIAGDPEFVVDFQGKIKPRDYPSIGSERMHESEAGGLVVDAYLSYFLQLLGITGFEEGDVVPYYETASNRLPIKRLMNPVDAPAKPGVLYADGGFSCVGRTLNYDIRNVGSQDGRVGSVMFWAKPAFDTGLGGRPRKMFTFYNRHELEIYPNSIKKREVAVYYFPHTEPDRLAATGYPDDTTGTNPQFMWGQPMNYRWMPHHSFVAHWRMGGPRWMIHSPSTSHDGLFHSLSSDHGPDVDIRFESRAWNLIGFSWHYYHVWDMYPQDPSWPISGQYPNPGAPANWTDRDMSAVNTPEDGVLSINGVAVSSDHVDMNNFPGTMQDNVLNMQESLGFQSNAHFDEPFDRDIPERYDEPLPYLRLGDLRAADAMDSNQQQNQGGFSADCTYGLFAGYQTWQSNDTFAEEWGRGRYYSGGDAAYVSPLIDAWQHLALGLNGQLNEVEFRSVTWTLYWARDNRDGQAFADNLVSSTINSEDRPDPVVPNNWDPVTLDIQHPAIGWVYEGFTEQMPSCAGGSSVRLTPDTGRPLRLRRGEAFQFKCNFNLAAGQAIYESPVLDDVTFMFTLVRPEILNWTVAE